jgi:hypothetical protein
MSALSTRDRKVLLLLTLYSLANCAVFVCQRIYPFIDLPNHLAAATIFRFYGEDSNAFADFFSVGLQLRPNLLHLLLCGSNIFPTVEFANKIFYCIYIFLLPLSIFLVIKKINGNPWCAFLSGLLLYNFNVSYGFTGFMMSIPFLLFFFFFFQGYREKKSFRAVCAVAVTLVALYFFHVLSALYAVFVFFLCRVYDYKKGQGRFWIDVAVIVPLFCLIFIWVATRGAYDGAGLFAYLITYYSTTYLHVLPFRLSFFFLDNFFLYDGASGFLIGSAVSCGLLGMTGSCWLAASKAKRYEIISCGNYLVLMFSASCLFMFLFLPQDIPGNVHYLYHRFSVLFFLGIVLLLSRALAASSKRIVPAACVFIALLHFILWSEYFIDFNRKNADFTPDFFPAASGSRTLAGMMFDSRFRGRTVYMHFPDYFIVWQQGISSTFLIDCGFGSFGSTTRKASEAELPVYDFTLGKHQRYDGRYNDMDYILVRGNIPEHLHAKLTGFSVLKKQNCWMLLVRDDSAQGCFYRHSGKHLN